MHVTILQFWKASGCRGQEIARDQVVDASPHIKIGLRGQCSHNLFQHTLAEGQLEKAEIDYFIRGFVHVLFLV